MNSSLSKRLEESLEIRREDDSLRTLRIGHAPYDFCSNDYLGISRHNELETKIRRLLSEYKEGVGSTGSRLIAGNSKLAEDTEVLLMQIFKGEGALIFNSGYNANIGLLSSVPNRGDIIFYDELSHASIKDGIRLSLANKVKFKHNDLTDLENKLKPNSTQNKFIVVESVYSMDGDYCPLIELVELSQKYDASLILDEAHSTGTWGNRGAGIAVDQNVQDKIFARVYTFGKAMGVHGACVVGSKILIDYLINFSRSFIYTTALPAHSIASINSSFTLLDENMVWQAELKEKIDYFNQRFKVLLGSRFKRTSSETSIQSIIIPGNRKVRGVAEAMINEGIDVRAILAPTVKKGQERIRICLHRHNTKEQIEGLLKAFELAAS